MYQKAFHPGVSREKYNTVHRVAELTRFQQHLLLLETFGVSDRLRLLTYLEYRLRLSEQWKRLVLDCNWLRTHHVGRVCRNNPDLTSINIYSF